MHLGLCFTHRTLQPVAVPSIPPAAAGPGTGPKRQRKGSGATWQRREPPLFPRRHTKAPGVKGGKEEHGHSRFTGQEQFLIFS